MKFELLVIRAMLYIFRILHRANLGLDDFEGPALVEELHKSEAKYVEFPGDSNDE